jgi:hypothetical protein
VSRPAEQLATEGYHTFENGQHNLSGPNSDVLLSSDFLATHCFFLRRDRERPQEIGLAFEPVPGRPMTDIEGVMWLNERTAELRSLEFSYTHLHRDLPAGDYGGTAEFQRLPSGGFIVRTWEIYSPIVQRFQNSIRDRRVSEVQVVGQRSEGGEVLSIIDREGNIVDAMPRAVLAGVVYDSTAGAPLVDAAVSLVGTNYTGRTDDTGRFRIPNLPPGTYAVSFEHAVLKSLDYTPPAVPVALVRGQATEVVLALPAGLRPVTDSAARSAQSDRAAVAGTQRTVEAAPSRDTRRGGPPSQLNGLVVDHGNSRPVREARVRIEGTNFDATTDGNGRFRFPDLPADTYTLVVERLGYVQQKNPIELESGRSYEVTVRLPARAVELDPITITVRSERLLEVGFYDRRESGLSGHYLTRADIDRRNTPYITDLLHNVPGVKVLYTEPGKRTVRFNRQVGASGRACEPDLYIDDRLYRASSPGMISSGGRVAWVSSGSNVDNFDAVPTVQVEGIEIYVGAATPIKYNSQCGVILLWTRHGEGN